MKWYYIKKGCPDSHTHCQVPSADPQTKTWQRVCLPYRSDRKRNNEGTTFCISNGRESTKYQGL